MSVRARFAAAVALALAACASGVPRPPMSEGERLARAKCADCHRLHEPGELSPERWRTELAEMERLKRVHLTDPERAALLAYLTGGR